MQGKEFLEWLWSHQPEGYATLVYRPQPDEWLEFYFHFPRDWDKVAELPTDGDLYFCPNLFSRKGRRKEWTLPSRIMYQDLDEVTPLECPIFPTKWWATSPDRHQGVWVVDSLMEPAEFGAMNRALNRACHADPGTWNLTRVLRVPGSHNAKRDCFVSEAFSDVPVLA